LRLVRLPAYSPDFNADEHIWAWVREEVKQRCRTELHSRADALDAARGATAGLPLVQQAA
jgi:hypothetical protein